MNNQRMHPNETVIDSDIYSDIFSTSAMRDVWSDRSRIQYYLDFEKALALTHTMPQKRNPISCAYITASSSVVRQHTASLLNAMNADTERATGTWEIEWLVLPEIFCLSAGALAQAKYMLSGLVVHPDNMRKNLQLTDGLINTEAIMMPLGPKMGRGKAHDRLAAISVAVS